MSLVIYRPYHNTDPPKLHQLWHACQLGRNAAEGFPCDVFELLAISPPFFERQGLIVAEQDGRVVGFVHAGFSVNHQETALDTQQGVLAAIMVHPDFRRHGIGRQLVQHAENWLRSRGSVTIEAGCGLGKGGFYCGIYGGLEPSGFCSSAAPWKDFFQTCGYSPGQETYVLRRDLMLSRDPVNARLLRHRRDLKLVITDRPGAESWWWFVRFGHLDSLRFEMRTRTSDELVASGQIVGMDLYIPKWGVRSVGIRGIYVPESRRRYGYAQSLVFEICRCLREESVQLVEAQVASDNAPAVELFTSARFELHGRLLTFRRKLTQ